MILMGSQEAILFDFKGDAIHSDYTVYLWNNTQTAANANIYIF